MLSFFFRFKDLCSSSTKNKTAATTTAEFKVVLVRAFIGRQHLLGIIVYRALSFIRRQHLSGVSNIIYRTLFSLPVSSRALPYAPGCSCVFPCMCYASESASVGNYLSIPCDPLRSLDLFILCVLNAISSKLTECPIIYIVSLFIGILMPYYLFLSLQFGI